MHSKYGLLVNTYILDMEWLKSCPPRLAAEKAAVHSFAIIMLTFTVQELLTDTANYTLSCPDKNNYCGHLIVNFLVLKSIMSLLMRVARELAS